MSKKTNVLISGSSRGLGRELAEILENQGYQVITMGFISKSNVDIRCDLLDLTTLEIELERIFNIYGAIDILVCNAGTGKKPKGMKLESKLTEYFRQKNFETTENLLKAATPYLKTPGASIIGISSIVALAEIPGAPSGYAEAKREMNLYFRRKAIELSSKGIRVNLISPGNIFFSGSRWEEISLENPRFVEELLREKVPLHEFILPSEIAAAIIYLSSAQARNITGVNLVIDGGQTL